jgi:ABC-type dipeptide/oligopeptide/nickel transport system ATPase component
MNMACEQRGIIILGNSGVGKSLIANVLLGCKPGADFFQHECSAASVTHETECREVEFDDERYTIFNIPGLIEDEQDALDRNKAEIDKAFLMCPNSIVAFVFTGGTGGRLRDEDVITFKAINDAYGFSPNSLLLIVNDLPTKRPSKYEGTMAERIRAIVKIENPRVCYLDRIDVENESQREQMRLKLVGSMMQRVHMPHRKRRDIRMTVDLLQQLKRQAKEQQQAFEQTVACLQKQIDDRQREFEEFKREAERRVLEAQTRRGSCVII